MDAEMLQKLEELCESALMAYSETQPDDEVRMARMIAPISEIAEHLKSARQPSKAEWQDISTAPWGKWVLLWWTPVNDNPYAETVVKGQVVAPDDLYGPDPKPTKYWDGGHAGPKVDEEGCKALDRITHWMPLPDRPSSRAIAGDKQ